MENSILTPVIILIILRLVYKTFNHFNSLSKNQIQSFKSLSWLVTKGTLLSYGFYLIVSGKSLEISGILFVIMFMLLVLLKYIGVFVPKSN